MKSMEHKIDLPTEILFYSYNCRVIREIARESMAKVGHSLQNIKLLSTEREKG